MNAVAEAPQGIERRLEQAWLSRGPIARSLLPVAALYGALTVLRKRLYDVGLLRSYTLAVPVVVVGNILAGGAGKTPTVMAVVRLLQRHGYSPAVVSRGYRRTGAGLVDVQPDTPAHVAGDEPLLLRLRTGVPVMVGQDRVRAARSLLKAHPHVNVIVSDDGLQHLRLARRAQVLVFDERGAGNGWWLPAGPLRERLPSTVPARTVVLYNAPAATTPLAGHLAERSLAGVVELAGWWVGKAPSLSALDALRDRRVIAAAGLARPQRFFDMLRACGLDIEPLALPDHHDYRSIPWADTTADVVVTEKDAVKLMPARLGRTRVWVAALDLTTDAAFDDALMALLDRPLGSTTREHPHGSPIA